MYMILEPRACRLAVPRIRKTPCSCTSDYNTASNRPIYCACECCITRMNEWMIVLLFNTQLYLDFSGMPIRYCWILTCLDIHSSLTATSCARVYNMSDYSCIDNNIIHVSMKCNGIYLNNNTRYSDTINCLQTYSKWAKRLGSILL